MFNKMTYPKIKSLIRAFLLSSIIFACSNGSSADSKKENEYIDPNPWEQNKRIARSINLGNMLEAPNEGDWGITLEKEFFQIISEAAFDAVRIPIRWSTHANVDSPWIIDSGFFARIDWAIDEAQSHDLAVIINIHHYQEIMVNPDEHKKRC